MISLLTKIRTNWPIIAENLTNLHTLSIDGAKIVDMNEKLPLLSKLKNVRLKFAI
jgi:hypothetical protein